MKNFNYFPLMSESFVENQPSYNTRNPDTLNVPFPRTNTIKINFLYQIPIHWNNLDGTIRNAASLNSFKNKLKKQLISLN